jgi:hypothetical protein
MQSLLGDTTTLHSDGGLTTSTDIVGKQAITQHFKKFFNSYLYKGPLIGCRAVSDTSVYSLFDIEQVIQRPEKYDVQILGRGSQMVLTGIWRLVFDPKEEKDKKKKTITDIWMLRSLTHEEKKYKLKQMPPYTDFKARQCMGPELPPNDARTGSFLKAAQTFDHSWHSGDISVLKDIMYDDVSSINPVFGEMKKSRKEYEEMVAGVKEFWDVDWSDSDIAVTAGSNKAFLWWRVHGTEKKKEEDKEEGKAQDMWGINVLEFECGGEEEKKVGGCKLKRVVGFRQPLLTEQLGEKMESGKQPYMETLSAEA